ncbi:MAG TPA: RloB family protein [Bacteroidales bacterium]|nr:RloB family protein [Bacteroidales bacterium]HSA43821.1 RloB family protein [Bacteroidales bacterium]
MAGKVKIDNAVLKRHQARQTERKLDVRAKRTYYVIVCEGEKTEPNYFEGLKKALPPGVLQTCQIDIHGIGDNTLSLVRKAKKIKKSIEEDSGRVVDKLWVVFDRDSFTPESFNNAILSCQHSRPKIHCAWSNEAFELWYLLHFHFFNTAISRGDYKSLIEKALRPHLGKAYRYRKNSEEMYSILEKYGNQEQAIQWAGNLVNQHAGNKNFATHNPCTMIYQLVEELIVMQKTK